MDISSNEVNELVCLLEQRKLRRLIADNNCIEEISFENLFSLQHVSLAFNALRRIPPLTDLIKCVYLDLKGNKIQGL